MSVDGTVVAWRRMPVIKRRIAFDDAGNLMVVEVRKDADGTVLFGASRA
jgi:hypothetical protein